MSILDKLLPKLPDPRNEGNFWTINCPVNPSHGRSVIVNSDTNGSVYFYCRHQCTPNEVLEALDLTLADVDPLWAAEQKRIREEEDNPLTLLRPPPGYRPRRKRKPWIKPGEHDPDAGSWRVVHVYPYLDERGILAYQVVRYNGKVFRIRRPCDDGFGWTDDLKNTPLILYHLPDLLAADPQQRVFIVEGEKDADRLAAAGFLATTNPKGPYNWPLIDDAPLRSRHVVIIPDNDRVGFNHAYDVARQLWETAASVRVLHLPGLLVGQDVSDWLDHCGDPVELLQFAQRTPDWNPQLTRDFDPEPRPRHLDAPPANLPAVRPLAQIYARPVHWLWPSRIALGKLTLITGDPGVGKSLLTLDLAARVSRGNPWPDSDPSAAPIEPASIILLSPEDHLADTIRPRLHAAGADLERIVSLTIPSPQHALAALDDALEDSLDHRLVIIDPLTLCVRAAPQVGPLVTSLLSPLTEFAERHDVAVLAVAPFDRAAGPRALYRSLGAREYSAARAAFALTCDQDNPHRRFLQPVKNNLAPLPPPLTFTIESNPDKLPVLNWSGPPDDPQLPHEQSRPISRTTDRALDFLSSRLIEGPALAADICKAAEEAGVSRYALFRAKQILGVIATRTGYADAGHWMWSCALSKSIPTKNVVLNDKNRTL